MFWLLSKLSAINNYAVFITDITCRPAVGPLTVADFESNVGRLTMCYISLLFHSALFAALWHSAAISVKFFYYLSYIAYHSRGYYATRNWHHWFKRRFHHVFSSEISQVFGEVRLTCIMGVYTLTTLNYVHVQPCNYMYLFEFLQLPVLYTSTIQLIL